MEKFPKAFIKRIQAMLPEKEWDDYFQQCTAPMPKVIRINQKIEEKKNWQLKPTAVDEAFFINRDNQSELPLGRTLAHFTGKIYIQTLSSMLPVLALDPQPGEKVLDLCSAPGSKTTFLSQKMQNTGLIVANEPSGSRSKKLAANLDRLGVVNTVMVQSDGTILHNFYDQEFDRVLLDAPCSSEGAGRKNSQFFSTMWSEKKILEAAKLQKRLIVSAFQMLAPGGIMIYSTCTSAPEENEAVVQFLFDEFPDSFELLPLDLNKIPHTQGLKEFNEQKFSSKIQKNTYRLWPHLNSDLWDSESFFLCKIRKIKSLEIPPPKKPDKVSPPTLLKKNRKTEVVTKICKQFGFPKDWINYDSFCHPEFSSRSNNKKEIPDLNRSGRTPVRNDKVIVEKQKELFLTTKDASQFCQTNLYRRLGIKIMDKDQNFTTEFVMKFGALATKNVIELDKEQKNRWLAGYELEINKLKTLSVETTEQLKPGLHVTIKYQNFCLGWGKVINNKIKNKLDRNLVI